MIMFGLDNDTINIIIEILGKYDKIEKKVIFGSRVTGKYKKTSDIDIALYGKNISFRDLSNICGDFDESDCVYKIDVVHYESLGNEQLKANIDKFGVEI